MKTTTLSKALGRKTTLALAIPLLMAAQAQGFEFSMGDLEGQVDSQISMGSSWRTESAITSLTQNTAGEESNSDDANKNYQAGDAFSQAFTGNHSLKFSYNNFGGVVSGKYWYDSALANNSVSHGHGATLPNDGEGGATSYDNAAGKLDDSGFNDLSKAQGAYLMDAFIYGEFELGEMPLDVRLGRQVVSWGESTFIPGALSKINPYDVNALRRPGAEIKDALLPVNMAYANIGLTEDVSAEAFYQLEYEATEIPACGTYFNTNDYASNGCNTLVAADGAVTVARADNGYVEAKDDGQFGVALRFNVGDTEIGAYAMNVHSRLPMISITKYGVDVTAVATAMVTPGVTQQVTGLVTAVVTQQVTAGVYTNYGITDENPLESQDALTQATIAGTINAGVAAQADNIEAMVGARIDGDIAAYLANPVTGTPVNTAVIASDTYYQVSNTEDQQIAGLSFATTIGPVAVSGELTHTKDLPLQINGPMLTYAALTSTSSSADLQADVINTAGGDVIPSFKKHDVSQLQLTGISTFDQVMGASQLLLVGELAYTAIQDLNEGQGATKFGRSDIFGLYNPAAADDAARDDGFITSDSWGYRARLSAKYPNAFSGINLTPTLSWKHDVEGYSQYGFVEGDTTLGFSLAASYQEIYSAEISYTQYSGGDYSVMKDRDFASMSVGMQF